MSHHVECFSAAVSALAGHGHIKQRLVEAFEAHLQGVDGDDLPRRMKQPFAELCDMMTRVAPLNGEGAIRASVRKMSVAEADQCARLVVGLFADSIRHEDALQDRLPLEAQDQAKVPPFLLKSV